MHLTFLGKKNPEKNLTFFNITSLGQREGKKNTKTWKIFFKRIFSPRLSVAALFSFQFLKALWTRFIFGYQNLWLVTAFGGGQSVALPRGARLRRAHIAGYCSALCFSVRNFIRLNFSALTVLNVWGIETGLKCLISEETQFN